MANNDPHKNKIFLIWLYRSLGVLAAFAIPLTHYGVAESVEDPMWIRLALGGLFLALVIASFFSRFIIRQFIPIVFTLGIVITLHLAYVAFVGGMDRLQFFTYFITLLCFSFIFRGIRYFLVLHGLNVAMAVVCWFSIGAGESELMNFIFAFAVTTVFGLGISIGGQREKRTREGHENQLRIINEAAFRQTSAGILVTDHKGNILHFNEQLLRAWNLDPELVARGDQLEIVEAARQALKNPAQLVLTQTSIKNDPMLEIDGTLEMKDGRFFRRISRPLLHNGNLFGRIWFYHDVTRLKREEARLEATREQMYRQNEVMVNLAGNNDMYHGNLEIAFQDVTRAVVTVMETNGAEIWLFDEKGEGLDRKAAHGGTRSDDTDSDPLEEQSHPAFFHAVRFTRVVDAADAAADPRTASIARSRPDIGSMLVAPIRLQGKIAGLVSTTHRHRLHAWPVESQNFLASISDFLAVLMETAGRHQAERQLEKSHAILRSVFELSGLGILVTTLHGAVITYNRLYLDMWSMDDEYMEKPAATVIAYCQAQLRNAEQIRSSMNFLLENPDQDQFDYLEFHDGRIAERFTSVLEVDERIMGRVWFFRDITDRIEAERRLRDSEQRNKAILNALPDLMLRLDPEGTIIDFKTPDGDAFPDRLRDLRGKNVRENFPEVFATVALENARNVQESGVLRSFEIEMNLIGQERDYEARIVPASAHEVLLIVRDITERKRAEKELVQRNYELDSFVYRASHDLKAPLNSLMGLIDIVRNETDDDNVLQYLGLMDKSVVKLDTFIRNLTDFSRINRLKIKYQQVDFDPLIGEIAESLRYMEHADRVRKVLTVAPGPPLYADAFHVGIVLSNLISNAIKYQDHQKEDSRVEISVQVDEKQAVVQVADNGLGIPAEHQDRIFELFFRASNQSFGSGLGLYITRNAVEKMEGTISFTSTPGQGTCFTVTIPNQVARILTPDQRDK